MKKLFLMAVLGALMVGAPSLNGTPRIAVQVSPVVAMEPAQLTIRTTIEPSEENRKLSVTIDSDAYASSSDIPLEGRNAARLNVIEIRDVPSGLYEVRAVVSGSTGPLAETNLSFNSADATRTNCSSASLSPPRSWWLKCATMSVHRWLCASW